ncbi:MAG TPA: glutamine synthetase [Devosia sp.]|nr:glutamine synthetase [Devosia sp.]
MPQITPEEWRQAHPDVGHVLAATVDLNGVWRGKRVPVADLGKVLDGALRLPLSVSGVDIWGEDIAGSKLVFEQGDVDGICLPTGRGIVPVNWTRTPTALVPLWLAREDGTPFDGDPRRALDAISQRYRERGLTPVVAMELEFYLVDRQTSPLVPPLSPVTGERLFKTDVLSIDELEQFETFLERVNRACREQGIEVDMAICENGPGQFEVNMRHLPDPLRAADDAVLFKRLVHGVARQCGFAATFMAKPFGQHSGSGCHVHFSLLDRDGANMFDNGSATGSQHLQHAVAGLLETMAPAFLTFAPHFNSYRRFQANSHAPTHARWGHEARHAAIRIPAGDTRARRIEHRVAGADANPYLVLASILGGALWGLEKKKLPPPALSETGGTDEAAPLPRNWGDAIDLFRSHEAVQDIHAPELIRMYCDCKEQELDKFARTVSPLEHQTCLETV